MHIHLPKPIHGWPEFFGEVGIIVLGILIAIGLEQLVEAAHWQHKVEQSTEAIREDLGWTIAQAAEQQVSWPCIDRQLELLEQRLVAPGPYKPAPLYRDDAFVSFTVRAPSRSWNDGVWQTVIAEGISTHLRSEARVQISEMYAEVDELQTRSHEADILVWRLRSLAQPVFDDPATRARTVADIEELRGRQSLMSLVAGQLIRAATEAKLMPSAREIRATLDTSGTIAFCRKNGLPIGTVKPLH